MATVEEYYLEYQDTARILEEARELSLLRSLEDNSRKALLLAAASNFERNLSICVADFAQEVGAGRLICSLVSNKAISRQYHTWFDWKTNNANAFFRMFGEEFRGYMTLRLDESEQLSESVRAFMEIGRERNRLVHEDFVSFALEKTTREIFGLYEKARVFVDDVPRSLRDCHQTNP